MHDLTRQFSEHFASHAPAFSVRAPGRVNIIGEHTDYNGYPVLPMAIDRGMHIVTAPNDDGHVRAVNADARFGERIIDLRGLLAPDGMPFARGDWGNYIAAAVRGVCESGLVDARRIRGFDACFSGDVPIAAGLSSSSALVVASGLAFLAANDATADPAVLAGILARAERHAGIEGGGMDQAVSLLAQEGAALRIDFHPLRTHAVPLPQDVCIVVCDSGVQAAKTAGARAAYNQRVIECRAAAAIIAHVHDIAFEGTPLLAEVVREVTARSERDGHSRKRASDGAHAQSGIVAQHERSAGDTIPDSLRREGASARGNDDAILMAAPYQLTDLSRALGWSAGEITTRILTLRDGSVCEIPADGLHVRRRCMHVLTEARRVDDAEAVLVAGDAEALGALMDASHASCRDLYDISCDALEQLVHAAKHHGALGARLTGAGFGGCTVNLVRSSDLAAFLDGVGRDYYAVLDDTIDMHASAHKTHPSMFVCLPAPGASVEWL